MRLWIVLVGLFLGIHGKSLNNPLSGLMAKETSAESKAFIEKVILTVSTHVAFAAIGLPPTLEDFKNDLANLTASFCLLPVKDQRSLVTSFKAQGEQARHTSNLKLSPDLQILDNRLNSVATRDLMNEVEKSCDWLVDHKKCLGLLSEKDPELARVFGKLLEEAVEQYKMISSQAGKDFVYESVSYLNKKKDKEVSDESLNHLRDNFSKLADKERVEVVRKMTWFLDPIWENVYKLLTSDFFTGKMASKEDLGVKVNKVE